MRNDLHDNPTDRPVGCEATAGESLSPRRRWLRVMTLATGHVFVDGYITMVAPLLAYMGARLAVSDEDARFLFSAIAIGASLSQPVWAWLCSRFNGRWFLILAPILAGSVVAVGFLDHYWAVFGLIVLAGCGTGAYHPVSGALAGKLSQPNRSLGISIFAAGGMIGVSLFPVLAAKIVERWDVTYLWPLAIPAVGFAAAQWRLFGPSLFDEHHHRPPRLFYTLRDIFGHHTRSVLLLFATAMLRSFPIAAYSVAVPFMVDQRGYRLSMSGYILGVFPLAMGVGGVLGSFLSSRFNDRKVLIASLAACIPAMIPLSFGAGYWLIPAAALAGAAIGSTTPLSIAMGQRLAPRGSQMLIALMMGLSWGLTGILAPPIISRLTDEWGYPWATILAALAFVPAVIAAWMLPRDAGGEWPSSQPE